MNSKIYFIVLIAFALVVRIYAIFELKQNFSNDESVTYLSATGNQVKYAQLVKPDSAYLDNYVKAQVWKNCYVSNPPFCFKKIAYDLTQYDIHPPLFFWLMHLFILLFGFHVYTGLILNLITTLLTLFTLYKFSNYVFNNSFKSLLVCTFWFLSPAIVQTDLEARHYQLFALFTILLSHIILKILNTQKFDLRSAFFVITISTLGMLTHYYFGFVLMGIYLLLLYRIKFNNLLLEISGCFVLSVGLFFCAFPDFFLFVKNYIAKKNSVYHIQKPQTFLEKVKTQFFSTLDFGAYGHVMKYIYLFVLVALLIVSCRKIIKHKVLFVSYISKPIFSIFLLFLWNCLFTFILYSFSVSPNQAVGEQYYSYIWPFFSILLVFSLYYIKIPVWTITSYLTLLFVFCFLSIKNSPYIKHELPMTWYEEANSADLLVIDSYDRCLLPRTLYFIKGDKTVFIGDVKNMKGSDLYKKIVLFYLVNEKGITSHTPLSGYKLIKQDKCFNAENYPYFMESYLK